MFNYETEHIIRKVSDIVLGSKRNVTLRTILSSPIHNAIKVYYRGYVYLQQDRTAAQPVKTKPANEIETLRKEIDLLLPSHFNFDKDTFTSVLTDAVFFTFNFLCKPRWTMREFFFQDSQTIPIRELKQGFIFFSAYDYYPEIMLRYIEKHRMFSISREQFTDLTAKIDRLIFSDSGAEDYVKILQPLSSFIEYGRTDGNGAIPEHALSLFFADKGFHAIRQYLKKNLKDKKIDKISPIDLVTVLAQAPPPLTPVEDTETDAGEAESPVDTETEASPESTEEAAETEPAFDEQTPDDFVSEDETLISETETPDEIGHDTDAPERDGRPTEAAEETESPIEYEPESDSGKLHEEEFASAADDATEDESTETIIQEELDPTPDRISEEEIDERSIIPDLEEEFETPVLTDDADMHAPSDEQDQSIDETVGEEYGIEPSTEEIEDSATDTESDEILSEEEFTEEAEAGEEIAAKEEVPSDDESGYIDSESQDAIGEYAAGEIEAEEPVDDEDTSPEYDVDRPSPSDDIVTDEPEADEVVPPDEPTAAEEESSEEEPIAQTDAEKTSFETDELFIPKKPPIPQSPPIAEERPLDAPELDEEITSDKDAGEPEHRAPSSLPYSSLEMLIDEDERKRFIRKLFNGDSAYYNVIIHTLDNMTSWKEASLYIDEIFLMNGVDPYSSDSVFFTDKVYSRFSALRTRK